MNESNIDFSGSLNKNLEQRGFPQDWHNRSNGELSQKWHPYLKEIITNVSVNQEWKKHLDEVDSLKNMIKTSESEEQRFQSDIERLNEQRRQTRSLRIQLKLEMHSHEMQWRNYEELMNAKKILTEKGFKFDS